MDRFQPCTCLVRQHNLTAGGVTQNACKRRQVTPSLCGIARTEETSMAMDVDSYMPSVPPTRNDIAQAFANATIITLSDRLFAPSYEATTTGGPKAPSASQSHIITQHPELESMVIMRSRHATVALG